MDAESKWPAAAISFPWSTIRFNLSALVAISYSSIYRSHTVTFIDSHITNTVKGELNVDKKWQSDDLFYIIINEIRSRVDQFRVILKKS